MAQIIKMFFALAIVVSLAEAWKKWWPVRAVGRITCDGVAMPYINLELKDEDPLLDDTMGKGTTTSTGFFHITGKGRDFLNGKPDPYIKIFYKYAGTFGRMQVVNSLKICRTEKTGVKRYKSYINFGTINLKNIHCKAYVAFYNAMRNFNYRVNKPLPYNTLTIKTRAILTGGIPYSTTDVIRIPIKWYSITYKTALHELALTVRHSYDGNMARFLWNAKKYNYRQSHSCGKNTNDGFAFNQGWAAFWAIECFGYYGHVRDYTIEGNVAKALRRLRKKCHYRRGYAKMLKVLEKNEGKIYSFDSYNNYHYQLYYCKLYK